MLGRPGSWAPVCMNVMAGSWLIASVCIDRTMHRSSTIAAVCGSSSLIHMPLWPYCLKANFDGIMGKVAWPEVMPVRRWPIADRVGQFFAGEVGELGLVVEEVDLRRAAGLEQVDDPLGLGSEGGDVVPVIDGGLRRGGGIGGGGEELGVEQRRERDGAEAEAGALKKLAAGDAVCGSKNVVHVSKLPRPALCRPLLVDCYFVITSSRFNTMLATVV